MGTLSNDGVHSRGGGVRQLAGLRHRPAGTRHAASELLSRKAWIRAAAAISLWLAALEQGLNVKLIERSGSLVRPTAKGLEVLAYVEQVLEGVKRFKSTVQSFGEPQTVRLGVPRTIVHRWLSDLLRLFAVG